MRKFQISKLKYEKSLIIGYLYWPLFDQYLFIFLFLTRKVVWDDRYLSAHLSVCLSLCQFEVFLENRSLVLFIFSMMVDNCKI